MATLIRNGRVLTNNKGREVHDRADILIEGEKIVAIGTDLDVSAYPGIDIVDASRNLVMPGFVDAHMHSNEGFEMGRYDNLPLEIWLSEVYPPFNARKLSWEEHYLRAMLVAIVSVKSGVITLQDDCLDMFFDEAALVATASRLSRPRAARLDHLVDVGPNLLGGLPFLAARSCPMICRPGSTRFYRCRGRSRSRCSAPLGQVARRRTASASSSALRPAALLRRTDGRSGRGSRSTSTCPSTVMSSKPKPKPSPVRNSTARRWWRTSGTSAP